MNMLLNAAFNGSLYLALFLYGGRKVAVARCRSR